MVFEHFALNANNVAVVVKWYVSHLRLKVARQQQASPFKTFLVDSSDRVILELFQRPDALMTNCSTHHQLTFNVSFVSEHAQRDSEYLQGRVLDILKKFEKMVVVI